MASRVDDRSGVVSAAVVLAMIAVLLSMSEARGPETAWAWAAEPRGPTAAGCLISYQQLPEMQSGATCMWSGGTGLVAANRGQTGAGRLAGKDAIRVIRDGSPNFSAVVACYRVRGHP